MTGPSQRIIFKKQYSDKFMFLKHLCFLQYAVSDGTSCTVVRINQTCSVYLLVSDDNRHKNIMFTSVKVITFSRVFVCLLAGLQRNCSTDFRKIWWKGGTRRTEETNSLDFGTWMTLH